METTSDDILREAREKLLTRGALLHGRVKQVSADLRREHSALPPDAPGEATTLESDEVLLAIEKSAYVEISRIEAALDRTEECTFGLCLGCGKEIEAARIAARPDATRCESCARNV